MLMTKTKTARMFTAFLIFALALLAPPVLAANLLAGMAGAYLLGKGEPMHLASSAKTRNSIAHEKTRVANVAGGVVVFEVKNGRTISRFYRT